MKILDCTIRFGAPPAADIVIFDETNSHLIKKVLNSKYKVEIYKMRKPDIWLGFRVSYFFLKLLCRFDLKTAVAHHRGLAIGILKQAYCIYVESCLLVIGPKAVVTYIDNSSVFGWLSKKCPNFPFIAIQNGSRLSYAANAHSDYYIQHLFCYGSHESKLFPSIGYHVEKYYPVGSLVASLHFDRQLWNSKEKYDILVVSTWRGNNGFQEDVKDTMRSMEIMDRLLSRYIEERGVRAAIILRAEKDSVDCFMPEIGMSEENYFKNIYKGCIEIIQTDFSKRNIFPLLQQSRVIVSCLSSALMEGLGIGKKILYCNFTGKTVYHQDIHPSLVISNENYDNFRERLDDMMYSSSEKNSNQILQLQKYYMSFPQDKATFSLISKQIDQIIVKAVG